MVLSDFYVLLETRLPNEKQTDCYACPGNLVANSTIGECWCPLGDLVFNQQFDYCKYSKLLESVTKHLTQVLFCNHETLLQWLAPPEHQPIWNKIAHFLQLIFFF